MVGWEANPFRKFRVLPTGQSKKAFKLAPIHESKSCKLCPIKRNGKCKFECCRRCCVKKQITDGLACKAHKVKLDSSKKKAAPAASKGPPRKRRRRDESHEEEEHHEEEGDESDEEEEEKSYEEEEEETGSDTMQIDSLSSKESSDSESEVNIKPVCEQCADRIGCEAYKPEDAKEQIMCSHSDCPNKGFFCMIPGCKKSCGHRCGQCKVRYGCGICNSTKWEVEGEWYCSRECLEEKRS
jgi:hypothetical protein